MINKYPKLRRMLLLQDVLSQFQTKIKGDPMKGTNLNWDDEAIVEPIINDLQRCSRILKQPIATLLNPSIFDQEALLFMCEQLEKVLNQKISRVRKLKEFLKIEKSLRLNIIELVNAALKNDIRFFKDSGKRLRLRYELLFFIGSALIQSCLKEIASKVTKSFLEEWWEPICPICGRRPHVAKLKDKKRYLLCTFCGAEYLADQFLCVNCGNVDPYALKFLYPLKQQGLRIDFCEKCKHYIKVIEEERLEFSIPYGLEDTSTVILDIIATQKGLIRD
ncbi:MAG: formate dehydrogenase accessory protein FdhE [Nitrososphaerales archaeon]